MRCLGTLKRTAPLWLFPFLILQPQATTKGAGPGLASQSAGRWIRINEIMPTPEQGGPGGAGEWVELRNTGSSPIDLAGWRLGDEGDPLDRLGPLSPGGTTVLAPGCHAVVLDPPSPDSPPVPAMPVGTVMLRPDDASIGNGLRGEGDRLFLTEPTGSPADEVSWSASPGTGRSLERADPPFSAPSAWRICRDERGSTPGTANSWTPLPGDRRIGWIPPSITPRAGHPTQIRAVLSDEGGAGLSGVWVEAWVEGSGGGLLPLPSQQATIPSPFDSLSLFWSWTPPDGGAWVVHALITSPARDRTWGDRDTLLLAAAWAERARVVSEALPRPEAGDDEWLELWRPRRHDPPGSVPVEAHNSWAGWRVRVSGSSGGAGSTRSLRLPETDAAVLLISPDGTLPPNSPGIAGDLAVVPWPGLRLSDEGSRVVLVDPSDAVADSAVLRPVPGLPRGHSLQRHDPDLPGWLPAAWRISMLPGENTPGLPPAPSPQFPPAEPSARGLHLVCRHGPEEVTFAWRSPADRLWIEARLYDLEGRMAARPIPRSLHPGEWEFTWRPRQGGQALQPGTYVLVVEAEAEDGGRRWRILRALGVRP